MSALCRKRHFPDGLIDAHEVMVLWVEGNRLRGYTTGWLEIIPEKRVILGVCRNRVTIWRVKEAEDGTGLHRELWYIASWARLLVEDMHSDVTAFKS